MAQYQRKLLILFIAAFGLALVVPCGSAQAWVSKSSARKQRYKSPFKAKWVSLVKKGKFFKYKRRELSSPAAEGGLIFVGADSGYFYAFDESGDRVWRVETKGSVNSTAATGLGLVFFGDDDGGFYALRMDTGEQVWRQQYNSPIIGAPMVVGNRVYCAGLDGVVRALDAESGTQVWSYTHPKSLKSMTVLGHSSPAYSPEAGGRLYVGFSDGSLVALGAYSGAVIWQRHLAGFGARRFSDIDMQPLIVGSRLYVATFLGSVYSLDMNSGQTLWRVPIGSGAKMAHDDEFLYISGSDGAVYALNRQTGKQVWKYETKKGALTTPIVYKGLVIVGSTENSLIFIDSKNGEKIIQRFARKNISSDPILTGENRDLLVYLSNGGRLYALQLRDDFRLTPSH